MKSVMKTAGAKKKRGGGPQELIRSVLGKRSDLMLFPPARMSHVH